MEIFLQCLDELDDLVFAGFSIWARLRRFFLGVALASAVALHTLPRFGILVDAVFTMLGLAMAAIVGWAVAAVITSATDRRATAPRA